MLRRIRYLLRSSRFEGDLAEELEFHRAMAERTLEADGGDPVDARFAARRAFGSGALAEDQARDVWVPRWLQGLGQDFRLAVRMLWSARLVSAVAILSLALGIGANTAIFSLINGLTLRTLPVAEPARLAGVSSGDLLAGQLFSDATWNEIRERSTQFGGALAWAPMPLNLSTSGEAQHADGLVVSGDFFKTLGVPAIVGRTFTADDDVNGGGPDGAVAVISYDYWQRRFNASASVLGTRVMLERVPFTIIGVTPPDFFGLAVGRSFDVAVPIATEPMLRGKDSLLNVRSTVWLRVMLRLNPAQSLAAATTALRAAQPQIRDSAMPTDFPQLERAFLKNPFILQPASAMTSALQRQYEHPLFAVMAVVALVLFVACANIANLLLARASGRRLELTVRIALGASRWRLARQWLVESLLLASAGAAAGLVCGVWVSRLLTTQMSSSVSSSWRFVLDLPLDWRVLGFTAALAIVTAALFGTAPALNATRVAPNEALKAHGRGATARASSSASGALIVTQVALSLVLVVAGGLFLSTFERLATRPLGFDRDRVMVATINAMHAPVAPGKRVAFYQELVNAIARVPGVARAAGSIVTPANGSLAQMTVGASNGTASGARTAAFNFVTPGWFATYGIALRRGRDVDAHDSEHSVPVAVINEAFERKFLPGGHAVGNAIPIALGPHGEVALGSRTVVGVVADAVQSLREPEAPKIYLPLAQFALVPSPMIATAWVSIRSVGESPEALAPAAAAALKGVDKNLTFTFRTMADQVNSAYAQERLVAMLSGFFGAVALLLAALGLYGVTAYTVSQRRTEIGIRMALGAAPRGVVRLVVSRVAMPVGVGIIAGGVLSLWASRFVAAMLYGLEPRDPATLAGACVLLTLVAAFAAWLPARHAAHVDPASVLRNDG
jgi:putative ABC transport system permease protein